MRPALCVLLVATAFAWRPVGDLGAQERTAEEVLRSLNRTLQENAYNDHDGKRTVTEVALSRGWLVIEVRKGQGGNTVSNVFQTALDDVDLTSIEARGEGDHMAVVVRSRGAVVARLKCVTGGNVTEWDLPARTDLPVELASNPQAAAQIAAGLRELIALARQDPRYGD
jgi:hypothetical protein